jgi:hypothetical protein
MCPVADSLLALSGVLSGARPEVALRYARMLDLVDGPLKDAVMQWDATLCVEHSSLTSSTSYSRAAHVRGPGCLSHSPGGRQETALCGAFLKRMMGLEPTTFCMATRPTLPSGAASFSLMQV